MTATLTRYWLWLNIDRYHRRIAHIVDRRGGRTLCGLSVEPSDRETAAEDVMTCKRCSAMAPDRWEFVAFEPPLPPARLPGRAICPAGHGSVDQIGQQVEGKGIRPGYWRCRECYRPLVGAVRVWR